MGDRRNIELVYGGGNTIYLYAHWHGTALPGIVASALKRGKERWDDDSYLSRIIFSEMVKQDIEGLTGFGIAPYQMDENHPNILIDLANKTVDGKSFKKFIDYHEED